ncbi:unnamed protein product, partial [Darwinula stevensoni]
PWEPKIPEKLESYFTTEVGTKARGWAIVFYHEQFDANLHLPPRKEAQKDVENLTRVLKDRGFLVKAFKDFKYERIKEKLHEIAHSPELADHDCLIVCFLSHGREGGRLYAQDDYFEESRLWVPFYGDECRDLAGKPKLFFIQACRGACFDEGVIGKIFIDGDDSPDHHGKKADDDEYHLPTHANILVAHTTYEGHVAFKNVDMGSYFIYTLCQVLEKHSETLDVMRMLTIVAGVMAEGFKSRSLDPRKHKKKQMPTIRSTLIREVYLKPKPQT